MMKKLLHILWFVSVFVSPVYAEQSLEQAASDPTASLMSLQFSDLYSFNYHHADEEDSSVVFRSAIPFSIGEQKHSS